MHDVVGVLQGLPTGWVYLVSALVVFAETGVLLGLVAPGEATLVLVGFLAFRGTVSLVPVIVLLVVAALAGDSLAFAEGRRVGGRLRESRLGRWVGEKRWARADDLLERRCGRAVLIARYVAFARTLLPRLAAMSAMPYRRFLPWNVLGVVTFVPASVLVGYLAGESYERVSAVLGRATFSVLLLVAMLAVLVVVGRYLGRHPYPVTSFGARLVALPPLRWAEGRYRAAFGWLTARFGLGGAVAVNVGVGMAAMYLFGLALTWAVDRLVRQSGFPLVDQAVANWMLAQRTEPTTSAALMFISVLRGSVLVFVVSVVALVLNWRSRSWRSDFVGVVGTAGAALPLVVLALVADSVPIGVGELGLPSSLFPGQITLATASLGMLGWLVGRRSGWAGSVAAWLTVGALVALIATARVYVGWTWPSEALTGVVLGSLWVTVFVIAWRSRDRIRSGQEDAPREPPAAQLVLRETSTTANGRS